MTRREFSLVLRCWGSGGGALRARMVGWCEPVCAQGQDGLRGHGRSDRVQVRWCAPDRGAPGLSPRRDGAGGPAGGRSAEDRRLAGPGAAGPGVPGTGTGTHQSGQDHGGVQALQVVVGGPARRLQASGAG